MGSKPSTGMRTRRVAFVTYDGMRLLDLTAPLDAFAIANEMHGVTEPTSLQPARCVRVRRHGRGRHRGWDSRLSSQLSMQHVVVPVCAANPRNVVQMLAACCVFAGNCYLER